MSGLPFLWRPSKQNTHLRETLLSGAGPCGLLIPQYWYLSRPEGGRGAIPCLVLCLQLLIRTSTIWCWWHFPSSSCLCPFRWVVFPQGWGCIYLFGVMAGAMCGVDCFFAATCIVFFKHDLWYLGNSWSVLLDNVLASPCRWQDCPSLSHLLWSDKIFLPSGNRECTHCCFLLKMHKTILGLSI